MAAENAVREFNKFRAKVGVFAHKTTIDMIGTMPSYQWWQQYGGCVPHLQWFAVRVLAMVSSSSGCERVFSKLGWIKNKRRNRLGQKLTEKSIYVHYNLARERRVKVNPPLPSPALLHVAVACALNVWCMHLAVLCHCESNRSKQ